jgi:hypothetical protein
MVNGHRGNQHRGGLLDVQIGIGLGVGRGTTNPAPAIIETSYANPGGTGDRVTTIGVSSVTMALGGSSYPGGASALINGSTANELSLGSSSSGSITYDFGSRYVINEVTWKQSDTTSHGTWQWKGSDDGSSWANIGSTFTLGGTATQTQTSMSANQTAYRHYRMEIVSGSASSGPYVREIEFKISTAQSAASTYSFANTGGSGNRSGIITASSSGTLFSSGSAASLIDGNTGGSGTWFLSSSSAGEHITFDFGSAKAIDAFIARLSGGVSQGVWQFQGSSDNSSWNNVGSQFTLNGFPNVYYAPVGNTTAYRYWRLAFVSGSRTSGPYVQEIEFRISA